MYISSKLPRLGGALVVGLLALLPISSRAACTTPVLSPATMTASPASGSFEVITAFTLTINCAARDTYTISADVTYAETTTSTGNAKVRTSFYRDLNGATPLFGSPLGGTAPNRVGAVPVTLYSKLSGDTSKFSGSGTYTVQISGKVVSGGITSPFTLTRSGTIVPSCAMLATSAPFSTVPSGTNPVYNTTSYITCSKAVAYTVSQQGGSPVIINSATVGYAWVFADSATTQAIADTPISSVGTGEGQFTQFYIRLDGITRNTPITAQGNFSGSIPIIMTY